MPHVYRTCATPVPPTRSPVPQGFLDERLHRRALAEAVRSSQGSFSLADMIKGSLARRHPSMTFHADPVTMLAASPTYAPRGSYGAPVASPMARCSSTSERRSRRGPSTSEQLEVTPGDNAAVLVYGCRSAATDHLYKDELKAMVGRRAKWLGWEWRSGA